MSQSRSGLPAPIHDLYEQISQLHDKTRQIIKEKQELQEQLEVQTQINRSLMDSVQSLSDENMSLKLQLEDVDETVDVLKQELGEYKKLSKNLNENLLQRTSDLMQVNRRRFSEYKDIDNQIREYTRLRETSVDFNPYNENKSYKNIYQEYQIQNGYKLTPDSIKASSTGPDNDKQWRVVISDLGKDYETPYFKKKSKAENYAYYLLVIGQRIPIPK